MEIDRIDHVVLTVRSIDATCAFYTSVLGMRVVTFAEEVAIEFFQPGATPDARQRGDDSHDAVDPAARLEHLADAEIDNQIT